MEHIHSSDWLWLDLRDYRGRLFSRAQVEASHAADIVADCCHGSSFWKDLAVATASKRPVAKLSQTQGWRAIKDGLAVHSQYLRYVPCLDNSRLLHLRTLQIRRFQHSLGTRDAQLWELLRVMLQPDELEAFEDGDIQKLVAKRYFSPGTFRHASRSGLAAALPDAPGLVDILMVKVAVPIAGGSTPTETPEKADSISSSAIPSEKEWSSWPARPQSAPGNSIKELNALAAPVAVQRGFQDFNNSSPPQSTPDRAASFNNRPGAWPPAQQQALDRAASFNRPGPPWPAAPTKVDESSDFDPSEVPLDRVPDRARFQRLGSFPAPIEADFKHSDAPPSPTALDRPRPFQGFGTFPAPPPTGPGAADGVPSPKKELARWPDSRDRSMLKTAEASDEEWSRTWFETYLKPPLLLYRRLVTLVSKVKLMGPRVLKSAVDIWRSLRGPRGP